MSAEKCRCRRDQDVGSDVHLPSCPLSATFSAHALIRDAKRRGFTFAIENPEAVRVYLETGIWPEELA